MARIHPPFAQPDPGRRATPAQSTEAPAAVDSAEQNFEMPSIDELADELPMIDEFLADSARESAPVNDWSETSLYRPSTPPQPQPVRHSPTRTVPVPEVDTEGWASADWQSYDWNQVSSLGAPAPEAMEAHAAWTSTDWESTSQRLNDLASRPGGLPAEEVARALDEIARRIRSGELSLERFHGTPPEAAIAAVFAALLRTRR
jgi:hypothetical protein